MANLPAILLLLRIQAKAKLRRVAHRLLSPRRILLTLLAVGLTALWMSNAALSIMLREPLQPDVLRQWLLLGLPAYACWHLLKLAHARPTAGIEWTSAEESMLCAQPLARHDLVLYKILNIATSAVIKAVVFMILMFPDLSVPIAGFAGMFLALLFLDLCRMLFEIVAWGVTDRSYRRLRCAAYLVVAAICTSALVIAMGTPAFHEGRTAGGLQILIQFFTSLAQLSDTIVGRLAQAPFQAFVHVIVADALNVGFGSWLAGSLALVAGAGYAALRADQHYLRVVSQREKDGYGDIKRAAEQQRESQPIRLQRLPRWRGVGAICWRQMVTARRHAGGLVFALALPAGLSCLPWLMGAEPRATLWNVTGALAFYSLLLLPTALKFDFQCDIDRMALVKSLPSHPLAVVTGQLATPVMIASAVQLVVLIATVITQQCNPVLALAAWMMLVTFNVAIFGLDNLVFLLFPYRIKQEGLFVFLRTTLVFTAKGILFTLALAVVLVWALLAPWIAQQYGLPADLTFVAGAWLLIAAAAWLLIRLVVNAFVRFDPSVDVPV